jgi:hypothetical protein
VKPEQLASPPLEVDEAPAPWTPEPPPRPPLPQSADDDLHEPRLVVADLEPQRVEEPALIANGEAQAEPEVETRGGEALETEAPVAEVPELEAAKESAPPDVEPEFVDRRRSAPRPFETEPLTVAEEATEPVATAVAQAIDAIAPASLEPERREAPASLEPERREALASAPPAATPDPKPTARPAAAFAGPQTPSRKKQRAAARRAERAARRAANAATRASEMANRGKPEAVQGSHVEATPVAPAAMAPAAVAPAAKPTPSAPTAKPVPSAPAIAVAAMPARAPEAPKPDRVHSALERFSDGPRSPRHTRHLAAIITGLIMLGMAVTAILLGRRGGFEPVTETTPAITAVEPQAQAPDPTVSVTPPPVAVNPNESPAAVPAPPDSVPNEVRAPIEPGQPVSAGTAAEKPNETKADSREYCLAVGSYLFEDRARELARTLKRRTGQTVRVVSAGRGAEKSYRILYGEYASEEAATRAADKLLARGIVTEALIEKLPQ